MQIEISGKTVYYQVEYGKRKKIVVDLSPEGVIVVKAPIKTGVDELEREILAKKKLILKTLERLENRQVVKVSKSYDSEDNFLFLGQAVKLEQLFEVGEFVEPQGDVQLVLKKFYTEQTKKIIKKRIKIYEKMLGVKAKSVLIVDSPGTWGTCNYKQELTFNYRLSMAPIEAIDYVVIHELCHIFHMNHDRSFWRKVGSIDPMYKEHSEFLNRYSRVMTI